MFQGPFRPFSDHTTRQCVQDLMDGYYPSELQVRYPNGVPFLLTDNRDVTFKQREYVDIFPGGGRQLGGQKGPSKLLPSGASLRRNGKETQTMAETETSVLPGPKVSAENFLSRLPASVVRGGRVLDVRAGVAEVLHVRDHSYRKINITRNSTCTSYSAHLNLKHEASCITGHITHTA